MNRELANIFKKLEQDANNQDFSVDNITYIEGLIQEAFEAGEHETDLHRFADDGNPNHGE